MLVMLNEAGIHSRLASDRHHYWEDGRLVFTSGIRLLVIFAARKEILRLGKLGTLYFAVS